MVGFKINLEAPLIESVVGLEKNGVRMSSSFLVE